MRREWSGWIKNRLWTEFEREARTDPSQMLADTVAELLRGFPDKADRKALKRVLYFLEQSGYEPQPIEETTPVEVPGAKPFEWAHMVSANAHGESGIVYACEQSGRVRWLSVLVSPRHGITDAIGEECRLEEARERLEKIKARDVSPAVAAEVDPAFALGRIKAALKLNQSGLPPTIAYWRSTIEKSDLAEHPALGYPRTPLGEEQRQLLLGLEPTLLWRLELGATTPTLRRLFEDGANLKAETGDDPAAVNSKVVEELSRSCFTDEVIADHANRLLDLAYLVHPTDPRRAGLAMAFYDELMAKGPESEYARATTDKTLLVLSHTMQSEPRSAMRRT